MRSSRRWLWFVALLCALGLVVVACGRDDNSGGGTSDTGGGGGDGSSQSAGPATTDSCLDYQATAGVSDDAIKIGSSFPQSGLYQAFATISIGYKGYFDSINSSNGGINGRQVDLVALDDEYAPDKTATNYTELTTGENVFALFNVVGTPNNLAIRDQQNADCVPNLFLATGAPEFGMPDEYPWTIGSIPTYPTEMALFVDYLQKENPEAKVAVLYQNDDFGKSYLDSFKALTDGTDITVVGEESYDSSNADVSSQVTTLAATDADTFLSATTALACPNSMGAVQESGWDVLAYISATCASKTVVGLAPAGAADGWLTGTYVKDPVDPEWDNDAGMMAYREQGAANGISAEDLDNGLVAYGWAMGQLLEKTIENASDLTRVDVMNSAWHLDKVELPLLLPGITANTDGADDPYPIEQMQLGIYNGSYWELQGDVFDFEGKSGSVGTGG